MKILRILDSHNRKLETINQLYNNPKILRVYMHTKKRIDHIKIKGSLINWQQSRGLTNGLDL